MKSMDGVAKVAEEVSGFLKRCVLNYHQPYSFCGGLLLELSNRLIGGFLDGWTDMPVAVHHEVFSLADGTPMMFRDLLEVSDWDVMKITNTDIPAEACHVIHIWICKTDRRATLDRR